MTDYKEMNHSQKSKSHKQEKQTAIRQTNLLEVIAGVDAGLDLSLPVELQQTGQGPLKELLVRDVAQVKAGDGLVGLHQLHGVEGQLVVPGFRHGKQILLLARHTVGCTWSQDGTKNFFWLTEGKCVQTYIDFCLFLFLEKQKN